LPISDKNFYNLSSAERFGWDPSWFCCETFDDILINNVIEFQRTHGLDADGLVGPATFTRAMTEREAKFELAMMALAEKSEGAQKYISCNSERIPIDWDKVVGLHGKGSLKLPHSNFKNYHKKVRDPQMLVTHWDACLSAASCHRVLKKRGISSHFVIDNDGTIYQMVDTQDIAWHAPPVNDLSIGIDISNAYYMKYQRWYRKKFGNRPVLEDSTVHGVDLGPHLGYYPVQIEAYKALVSALSKHYDIPLECPTNGDGTLLTKVKSSIKNFTGTVCHYHVSRKKIDCAGLDLVNILEEIRDSGD